MKYLIVGAGGTGGLIGGYLAKSNYDATLVARGEHLAAIKDNGLTITTQGEAPFTIPNIQAFTQDQLEDTFDVVFICVKAYHIMEILPSLAQVCTPETVVIPILNSMGAGNQLRAALPAPTILDGCIYVTGYVEQPGKIIQNNKIFRIVYGPANGTTVNQALLEKIDTDLNNSGIKTKYTKNIQAEIFKKISFTSAFAATAAPDNLKAADLQQEGPHRDKFVQFLAELKRIAEAAEFGVAAGIVKDNIAILDHLSEDFTASIQKDMAAGRPDEREDLIFDIVRMADRYQVEAPNYLQIAKLFGYN